MNIGIVGGGAAGMMAGIMLARASNNVSLFEKNEKLGKKIYITGKGRCNVTNACDYDSLIAAVTHNQKFIYSSFHNFNNFDLMDFFENLGLKLKIERGNRVFPVSDHSSDVIKALEKEMRSLGVNIHLNTNVEDVIIQESKAKGLIISGEKRKFDAVILATGGLSYPSTGSTGDGFRMLKKSGITISPLRPSLVPFNIKEEFIKDLQGLSLKNIALSLYDKDKLVYSEIGELLFTHFGISGPLVLKASSIAGDLIYFKGKKLRGEIDLKPYITKEELDKRLIKIFSAGNSFFKNSISSLFPSKLIPTMINLSEIPKNKPINEITKEERKFFVDKIKALTITVDSLRGFNEAVITSGGVDTIEINPSTMELKKIKNLYCAGEMINVDAITGGFNLQIAFSTAVKAALSINKKI